MKCIDIEVYIITYNRIEFIDQSVHSILNQSYQPKRLVIFDNGSIDGTREFCQKYIKEGIELIHNNENNQFGIWQQIKEISKSDYIVVFHDDDVMHPYYLESVVNVIYKHPELVLICSQMKTFSKDPLVEIINDSSYHYLKSYRDFAYLLYAGHQIPFCSAVYRRDIFINLNPEATKFNKFFDRPFMIDAAKFGEAVVLNGRYIYLRIHENQDSKSISQGRYIKQLLELNKFYYNILGDSFRNKYGRLFNAQNYNRLIISYRWMGGKNSIYTYKYFIKLSVIMKATSVRALVFGFLFNYTIGVINKGTKYLLKNS
jgi:glycosyltransferase involved in cell wall biosynthesis